MVVMDRLTRETALSFGPFMAGGARRLADEDCGRDDMLACQFAIRSIDIREIVHIKTLYLEIRRQRKGRANIKN